MMLGAGHPSNEYGATINANNFHNNQQMMLAGGNTGQFSSSLDQ